MSNFKLQFVTLFGYDYAKGAKELGVAFIKEVLNEK